MYTQELGLSLYIHIPFCRSKCSYCDFFSIVCNGKESIPETYVNALISEIKYNKKKFIVKEWNTIYIGGGTPSLLNPEQLKRILDSIGLNNKSEVTIEVNPADVNLNLLSKYKELGINRISMGIQTFDQKVLSILGRRSDAIKINESLELLSTFCRENCIQFSCDLISGLPGLSDENFIKDINKLISYKPDHISLYALTVEEGTLLFNQCKEHIVTIDQEKNDIQWIIGRDLLENANYKQYEVSNFALSGHESKHNKVYWKLSDYVGVGSGATGTTTTRVKNQLSRKFEEIALRYTNTENIDEYIQYWNSNIHLEKSPRNEEMIDFETRKFEYIMMGLRLSEGINSIDFFERFSCSLEQILGADIENGLFCRWEKKQLSQRQKNINGINYKLTKEGLLFLNTFLESL